MNNLTYKTSACRYCGGDRNLGHNEALHETHPAGAATLADIAAWHDSAECVAAAEPMGRCQ